jgi:TolA-binding protein
LSGCSTLGTSQPTEKKADALAIRAVDDLELRQSRIFSRLDELEMELKAQKEKVQLLEQGLLTGLAPEGLKHPIKHSKPSKIEHEEAALPPVEFDQSLSADGEDEDHEASKLTSAQQAVRERFAKAKELYDSGSYGLAISEFANVTASEVADSTTVEARFWLGKSFLALKEYSSAQKELQSFMAKHPANQLFPRAKLEHARALIGLNLREKAGRELRQIAADYSEQEVGELASAELKSLNRTL